MTERPAIDLAELPDHDFGPRATTWWGTLGFVAIEGTGFVLAVASYFYLAYVNPRWPIDAAPPPLGPATWVLIVLVASLVPNMLLDRWAQDEDMPKVRFGLVLMSILGVLPLVLRYYEIAALNIRWDNDAYGSIVWVLLGLHTVHLLTDVGDTLVLTALMFTRHGYAGKRFGDVSDNCFYWNFVVIAWAFLYAVIYWVPRL